MKASKTTVRELDKLTGEIMALRNLVGTASKTLKSVAYLYGPHQQLVESVFQTVQRQAQDVEVVWGTVRRDVLGVKPNGEK